METINKTINIIKDAYLYVIEGIAAHPHIALWVGGGYIAVRAYLDVKCWLF